MTPQSPIDVVVRCKNEMPHVVRTLDALTNDPALRVTVIDSGSTDGSLEVARSRAVTLVEITRYVPGQVLNDAMERTSSPIVAFVNADAVPLAADAVRRLVHACENGAAASYGRQLARPSARPITQTDHTRAFPPNPEGPGFRHFFSMACSAIRRDFWQALPFDPHLRYSEDVDWTWRVRALGASIVYVPDALFEHSHDYDAASLRRRMLGEAEADRAIFRTVPRGLVRGLALPLAAQLTRDVRQGLVSLPAMQLRAVAQRARFDGARIQTQAAATTRLQPSGTTLGRDPRAEQVVTDALSCASQVFTEGLGSRLLALVLLGSFGAGEGAVEVTDGIPRIHNDLDLVAVVANSQEARSLREPCRVLAERASTLAGAVIDVWPVGRDELADPKGKLLWVDAAVRGGRVLTGDLTVMRPLDSLGPRSVASGELGRLLVNRATGLALSRLAFEAGDDEAVRGARHVAKAALALGDALLVTVDQYPATLRARLEVLQRLAKVGAPFVRQIETAYAQAIAFREAPTEARVLLPALEQACQHLWGPFASMEAHRLGTLAATPMDYAEARGARFPELSDVSALGRTLGGLRGALSHTVPWRASRWHPRESLARAAVVLAFEADRRRSYEEARRWLRVSESTPQGFRNTLERLRDIAS